MTNLPKSALSPLTIAAKLAAAANLTEPVFAEKIRLEPRLVQLLWFLQWTSMQPGGLEKFRDSLLAEYASLIGPPALHHECAALTFAQRQELFNSLPGEAQSCLIPYTVWERESYDGEFDSRDAARGCGLYCPPKSEAERSRFQAALMKVSTEQFRAIFISAAQEHLAAQLRSICEGPARWIDAAPWYCEKLIEVLFDAMAAHATRAASRLARTEVVSLTFDRLDYAWQGQCLVKIEGDARTGKTEAVETWCFMYPGRARPVATPCSNCQRDLLFALAESLGLPCSPSTRTSALKDQVQFIIRHSGLFFIFDEAHFLLPMSYGRNTNPARLDWVRTEIIDKGLPVALVCTPQAFRHSVERFQKWTGYNFAQFLGRIMLDVTLPNELGESDLRAVAKIQGPDIPEKFHLFIVARAMQSEGYLKVIEGICSRARFIARRDGHPVITLADVELAASEVTPLPATPAKAAPSASVAPALRHTFAVKRGRPIRAIAEAAPMLQGPSRGASDTAAPALEMRPRTTAPVLEPV